MPVAGEKAGEWTLISMVDMVLAAEFLISGDMLPAPADGGGMQEVGRLRGKVENDLTEEVVVVERIPPHR
jgi:hypothetical protein